MLQPESTLDTTPAPKGKTQAELYQFHYEATFNKLTKAQQEKLNENLLKLPPIRRGQQEDFPNVRDFIREVCSKAEADYDKSIKDSVSAA